MRRQCTESAYESRFYTVTYFNDTQTPVDPLIFLYKVENELISELNIALSRFKSVKAMLVFTLYAYKAEERLEFSVKSKLKPLYTRSDLKDLLLELFESLIYEMYAFSFTGSGFSIETPIRLDLHINKYIPLKIGCFLTLPAKLRKLRSLQNFKTNKSDCFRLSILSDYKKPKTSVKQILLQNHIDFSSCSEPMEISKITKFEEQNSLAISIFGYENSKFYPIRVSKFVNNPSCRNHDLLLLQQGNKAHFCNIRNLNMLLRPQLTKHRNKIYVCRSCFSHHLSIENYQEHVNEICATDRPHRAIFPKATENYTPQVKFNNYKFTTRHVFWAVWDVETLLIDTGNQKNIDPNQSATICIENHKVLAIGCVVHSYLKPELCGNVPLGLKLFIGNNAIDDFINFLNELVPLFAQVLNRIVPLVMTKADEKNFEKANACELCHTNFGLDPKNKHRDHCHIEGFYRAALCQKCNQQRQVPKTIPIFAHNAARYDNILILRSLHKLGLGSIKVLQKGSLENFLYINVCAGDITYSFKDSYALFSSSLSSIVESLPDSVLNKIEKYVGPTYAKFAKRKSFFPYSLCKSEEELRNYTNPPPKSAFFSNLTGSTLSENEYEIFLDTWKSINCRNLLQFLNFYLALDCWLLILFLEYYEENVYSTYGLGLFHFLSLAQLSFNQALIFTKSSYELITDPNIYFLMKRNLKGGIVSCSKNLAIPNNPQSPHYDKDKSKSYLIQLDINSNYSSVISHFKFPVSNYEFDQNLEKYNLEYIMNWSWSLDSGCFLFVDINMSNKLKDFYNDFPLLSVREKVGEKKEQRLILTLANQKNYFCHIYMLQMLLKFGLKLIKVRTVITFKQKNLFHSYITRCIEQRQKADSKIMSDFQKLLCNVLYGKCLFLANATEVTLFTNAESAQKKVNKFTFRERIIYSENLISIISNKRSVRHTSALLIGNTILEISKIMLYSLYYEHILSSSKCKEIYFNYCDTDCANVLVICDENVNIHDVCKNMALFDASNYPKDSPYYSDINKKKLGFIQDEGAGKIVTMYVGLSNKTYMISYSDKVNKVRSKGIPKRINLQAKDYLNCLITNDKKFTSFYRIDRRNLTLKTVLVNKMSLSTLNDKRNYLDGINTLAPGHWRLNYPNYDVPRIILSKFYECTGIDPKNL